MMRNLLVVSLDTLRVDVAYSGKFPTLRHLDEAGCRFGRTVSSSPLTPSSHASVFTGLQPASHGIRHLLREQVRPEVSTLALMLSAMGYVSGAVVASPGLNRWYGLSRGFSHYDDEVPRLADGRDPFEVSDVKVRGTALKRAPLVTDRALAWLARQGRKGQPFFLFAHFFDAHWPYGPPQQVGKAAANRYEEEVAYMDYYLGELLRGLEEMGHPLSELVVVCFSDHGEDLGGWYANDHSGNLGHPEEEGHGCLLFDVTQLVPLWVLASELPRGQEVTNQVRLVDVAPTILELLGLPMPRMDGRSLLTLIRGNEEGHRLGYSETFYPEERSQNDHGYEDLKPLRAVRLEDRWKLIWEVGGDRVELYDLAADPLERSPLSVSGAARPFQDSHSARRW